MDTYPPSVVREGAGGVHTYPYLADPTDPAAERDADQLAVCYELFDGRGRHAAAPLPTVMEAVRQSLGGVGPNLN